MIPKVLPAPTPWLALVYLMPSLLMLVGVMVKWRRITTLPSEERQQAKVGTLRFAILTFMMLGIVIDLIRFP